MKKLVKLTALALVLGTASGAVLAKSSELILDFAGTLIAPANCTIAGGAPVAFGDVKTDEVTVAGDTTKHQQPVNYTVTCQTTAPTGMTLALTDSVPSAFGGTLTTKQTGLGIKIQAGATPLLANGATIPFDHAANVKITAVLVKDKADTVLTPGAFSNNSAKLVISYL